MAKKKTPDQLEKEQADARKAEQEERARQANQKRNDERLDRLARIADNRDATDPEKQGLEDVTDEMLDEEQTRGRADETDQEDGDTDGSDDETVRHAEREDRDADEARDAGADDSRRNAEGKTEYRLVVNGKERWLTLEQLRATAGKVESADEYLRDASERRRTTPADGPSPEELESQRQARARQEAAETQAQKARLKDLYTRASMGDEEAIDQLAEIQAGLSRVTPDVLRIVDERVDARVVGRTSFEKAVSWFEGEYADELATPTLKRLAARRDKELADEHPDMEPRERLRMVGDELRQIRTDLGGTAPQGGRRPLNKQQRKERLPSEPQAGGRQRPQDDEDEEVSTSDQIAAMARARGQARAIKH